MKRLFAVLFLAGLAFGQDVTVEAAVSNPLTGVQIFPSDAIARAVVRAQTRGILQAGLCPMPRNECEAAARMVTLGKLLRIRSTDPTITHFAISFRAGETAESVVIPRAGEQTPYLLWRSPVKLDSVVPLRADLPLAIPD